MNAVALEKLEALAAVAVTDGASGTRTQKPHPHSSVYGSPAPDNGCLNLPGYLSHYGVGVQKVKDYEGGILCVLEEGCLFDSSHVGGEAAIGQTREGKLYYQCFHNSCKGRTWSDARKRISGDAPLHAFMPGSPKPSGRKLDSARGATREKSEHIEAFHATDLGNAKRLVARHGENIRYVSAWGKWLVWDGRRWAPDETGEVHRLAKETVLGIYTEVAQCIDDDQRRALAKHARSSESAGRLAAMVLLAQTEESIPVLTDDLDRDPWRLNLLNGTLDLKTGELRSHRREDLITKLAPVACDPLAECPTWLSVVERAMDNRKPLIEYLQTAFGYCVTGDTSEKAMLIFHGSGDNAKSVITTGFSGLLGDYAQETPVETLTIRKNEGIPNDVARLKGARLVTASEGERGQRLAESLIKRLTGGDKVTARFLHQEFFEFFPQFKIILSTNNKPVIRGGDQAIWNRIHLVPFDVCIPKSEQIPRTVLMERIKAERSGMLNWIIEGCLRWQRDGLKKPGEVEQATAEYRGDMDLMAGFLGDCCKINPLAKTKTIDLFNAYERWCTENKEESVHMRTFVSILQERGFKRARIGARADKGFQGIGLISGTDRQTNADRIFTFSHIEKNQSEKKVKTESASVCESAHESAPANLVSSPSISPRGTCPVKCNDCARRQACPTPRVQADHGLLLLHPCREFVRKGAV